MPEYAYIQPDPEERLNQWMIETDDPFDHGRRNSETDDIVGLE